MSDEHLYSASRVLRQILAAEHPQHTVVVRVEPREPRLPQQSEDPAVTLSEVPNP
jgi:hypothetical protein